MEVIEILFFAQIREVAIFVVLKLERGGRHFVLHKEHSILLLLKLTKMLQLEWETSLCLVLLSCIRSDWAWSKYNKHCNPAWDNQSWENGFQTKNCKKISDNFISYSGRAISSNKTCCLWSNCIFKITHLIFQNFKM